MKLGTITNGKSILSDQAAALFQQIISLSWLGTLFIWSVVIGIGLIFLLNRYYHAPGVVNPKVGFFCSAYFFVIITPVLYYLVRTLSGRVWIAAGSTGIWWLISTLPYRWLGLNNFYYQLEEIVWKNDGAANINIAKSTPEWFPEALHHLPSIPGEGVLFFSMILFGVVCAIALYRSNPSYKQRIIFGLVGYFLVLFQTWLHLSLRSPYMYYTKWYPDFHDQFFVKFMLPGFKGAVNADLTVFRDLELLFMGKNYYEDILFRRSAYFYVTSQFSYFFNLYYVSLIINMFLWFAATAAGYLFTRKYWSERTALLTAGFIATGTGFIMFVAQPMSYLAGYAIIIILVYLFDRLVIDSKNSIWRLILFAAILGLASMVYDIFPFYIYVIGMSLYRKVDRKHVIIMLIIAVLTYGGLLVLYERGLNREMMPDNSQFLTGVFSGFIQWALQASADQWYLKFRDLFSQFSLNIISVFIVLPVLFALPGLSLLKNRDQKFMILFLFLPAFLTQAALQFGNATFTTFHLYELPRFLYIAYPAVYILAALFLDNCVSWFSTGRFQRAAALLPWAGLLLVFMLNNIDILGIPSLYYHLYFSTTGPLFIK